MKHRNNNGGPRRYPNSGGHSGNRAPHDAGNIQRQKHHATQQREKYSNMAREAQINGDRVDVEYYLQHVEHYSRVLTDIFVIEAERYAHQREQQIIPGGPNDPNAEGYQPVSQQDTNDQGGAPQTSGESADQAGHAEQSRPRHQRRPYQQSPAPDNGAAEANSNASDIPLPDSILPPV